jgi:hypothetical protein
MVDDQSIYRKHVFDSATYDSEGRRRDAAEAGHEVIEIMEAENGGWQIVTGDARRRKTLPLRTGSRYRVRPSGDRFEIDELEAGNDSQQREAGARVHDALGAVRVNPSPQQQQADLTAMAARLRRAWGGQ